MSLGEFPLSLFGKVQTLRDDFNAHAGSTASGVHGSTSAATANKLVHRDANGRAQFADPSVDADAATRGWVLGLNYGPGTVKAITAGVGLTGGTINSSGTIALANTGVTSGSYDIPVVTVDAQGRITNIVKSPTLNDYAKKTDLFSGSYNSLSNKPSVISELSDIGNGVSVHKLRITSTADLSESSTEHGLQIGSSSDYIGIDINEIGKFSNGSNDTLYIQLGGADTVFGGSIALQSQGDVGIDIQADTNNSNEADHPYIRLSQDGGSIAAIILIDDSNQFRINASGTGHPIVLEGDVQVTGNLTENTAGSDSGGGTSTPPPPSTCPTGDTPIELPDGSTIRADKLVVKQSVASMNLVGLDPSKEFAYEEYQRPKIDGSKRTQTTVTAVEEAVVSVLYRITAEDHTVRVSAEHPFLVFDGSCFRFKRAEQLTTEDSLVRPDNSVVALESIEKLKGRFKVYKISCEPYDLYVTAGLMGHNIKQ